MARTSHLQTQLLSALDTLDASRTSHAHELASEIRTRADISDKLARYVAVVRAVESERDDLKDAVTQLVEKGGCPGPVFASG
jgi:hypothetical protein